MSTMPGLPTRPCFYDIDLDPVTEEGAWAVLGLHVPDFLTGKGTVKIYSL